MQKTHRQQQPLNCDAKMIDKNHAFINWQNDQVLFI